MAWLAITKPHFISPFFERHEFAALEFLPTLLDRLKIAGLGLFLKPGHHGASGTILHFLRQLAQTLYSFFEQLGHKSHNSKQGGWRLS